MSNNKLSYEEIRAIVPDDVIDFETTEEIEAVDQIIGQERAVNALKFGLHVDKEGFNIYIAGPPGTGKKTAAINFIEESASSKDVPDDWCYVNNFDDPLEPNALRMPPGMGRQFQKDMEKFSDGVVEAVRQAFESKEYQERREESLSEVQGEREQLQKELQKEAEEKGFAIRQTPVGLVLVPIVDGRPARDISKLPRQKREEIEKKREELRDEIQDKMREFRSLGRKAQSNVEDLNKEVALYAIQPLLDELEDEYGHIDEISEYLEDVKEDVLDNVEAILAQTEQQQQQGNPLAALQRQMQDPRDRYKVNVIVDNSDMEGAPVEVENNPTYPHLLGRVEKEAQFGALVTNYMMIRAGSAHKANGGFLIIPVRRLLMNPIAYDSLKRAITEEKLEIEDVRERYGLISTKTLSPEPIPFNAKVVLIGDPRLYYMLYQLDPDFKEIFKVKSEFGTEMDRTDDNVRKYAKFICTLCEKETIKPLDKSGVKEIIGYGSRVAADQEKLTTMFSKVADLIRESDYYATKDGSDEIMAKHVRKALEERIYRSNLLQERIQEAIERGTIFIDTTGEVHGQVNGLSVINLGDYMFGRPSRVTATVGLGKKGIIDIEREADLGGPIHTKGVQIIQGYLNDKYARERPLSLDARLVFEQSYGGVEGDSASSTELYAILSSLIEKPIKQNISVTGSVNQRGQVQPIGGVNEKIEGYYEVSKAKGMTGDQGVMIPRANVKNLMLKPEVVEAVKDGKFHIYAVETIDEGIEVLTGIEAGELQEDGEYPEETINYMVRKKLDEFAKRARKFDEEKE
ncbi:AAA family ATPase [Candidatus Bathyarchaeota archaeon]|nr:AAA family ATPase [Candidatus Bathyarchaeota archaeon]